MKKLNLKLFILPCILLFFSGKVNSAIVYANSQSNGANGLCIGCSVSNPGNAVDGNQATYSTLNITVGTGGAYLYQDLNFPTTGSAGDYAGFVIEDDNLGILNATLLGGLNFTTYLGGVSNNDSRSSSQLSINLVAGSTTKYYVEFPVTASFDQIHIQFNAGIVGALNKLRIYYGYYNPTPLPVFCTGFIVKPMPGKVQISWTGYEERNCQKYLIETTDDNINFRSIAEVLPGNKTENRYLKLLDNAQLGSLIRISRISCSGTVNQVYKQSMILIPSENNFDLKIRAEGLSVHLAEMQDRTVSMEIFEISSGRKIVSKSFSGDIFLSSTNFKAGPYILTLSNENGIMLHSQKFMVLTSDN